MIAVSARTKMVLVLTTAMLMVATLAFSESRMNPLRYESKTNHRLFHGHDSDEQNPQRDCIPLAFAVECSSDEISLGKPVECRLKSDAREDAPIVVKWTVSRGASKRAQTGNRVMILLTNSARAQIRVTMRVVTPKVCFSTASKELRVDKAKGNNGQERR